MNKTHAQFLAWLQQTLIPDLKDSGRKYTAADLAKAVKIALAMDKGKRGLTKAEDRFVDYLTDTLIPDLYDSGTNSTADDFQEVVDIIERLNR